MLKKYASTLDNSGTKLFGDDFRHHMKSMDKERLPKVVSWRLDPKAIHLFYYRCNCNNCEVMKTARECRCCREIPVMERLIDNLDVDKASPRKRKALEEIGINLNT
jgi:hypothetical protein